jgi:hypothetical protein
MSDWGKGVSGVAEFNPNILIPHKHVAMDVADLNFLINSNFCFTLEFAIFPLWY